MAGVELGGDLARALDDGVEVERPDGGVLLARMHSDALHLHVDGIAIIIGIATLVALAMYPVARRLTRQLESLSASVDFP